MIQQKVQLFNLMSNFKKIMSIIKIVSFIVY